MTEMIKIWRLMFIDTWWLWAIVLSGIVLPLALESAIYHLLVNRGQATLRLALVLIMLAASFPCLAGGLLHLYNQPAETFIPEFTSETPQQEFQINVEPIWGVTVFLFTSTFFAFDHLIIPVYGVVVAVLFFLRGALDGLNDSGFMDMPLFGKTSSRRRRKQ